jgi:putative acetyltransferase
MGRELAIAFGSLHYTAQIMGMDFSDNIFRLARMDDLASIHAIRREAILGISSAEFTPKELQDWAEKRAPEYFAPLVERGLLVLAEREGVPIAWGSSAENKIEGVYVRPSAGRAGVGRLLVAHLEDEIARRGHSVAHLAASLNAASFYAALGYCKTRSYSAGQAFHMQKKLVP